MLAESRIDFSSAVHQGRNRYDEARFDDPLFILPFTGLFDEEGSVEQTSDHLRLSNAAHENGVDNGGFADRGSTGATPEALRAVIAPSASMLASVLSIAL